MEKHSKNTALWLARFFVGLLFIVSGLIKLDDPLGFSYKLEEYFEVFHLVFLNPFAVFFAITLSALEVILGLFLITGFYAKKIIWGLLILIIFFTFLTFYSAAFEVVKTCGCFGEAIPLTPWQSFTKDVILLILVIYLFIKKDSVYAFTINRSTRRIWSLFIVALPILLGLYTYTFLPIIDFLPYKIGVNIPESMKVPEGAPHDEFEMVFTLKNIKTGEQKEMSDKEYLETKIYENADWELKASSEPKLVKKGFHPKISDLNIYDAQGVSYTDEIFGNPYYNLVAVGWNLKNTQKKAMGDINAIAINAVQNFNVRSVLLTSNSAQDAAAFSKDSKLFTEIFYADAVPLKSMIRSNPGLILLKNGVIINKWPSSALPTYNQLVEQYFSRQ